MKTLIGYRKRRTSTKVDYVQSDLCEFKTYGNYLSYLDRISQKNAVVVNWMLYAIPYNHLAAIPVGILLVCDIIHCVTVFKYPTLFLPEGSQQTDLAIQENTSSIEGTPKRSESSNELF